MQLQCAVIQVLPFITSPAPRPPPPACYPLDAMLTVSCCSLLPALPLSGSFLQGGALRGDPR
jgi:hypothetical protein